MGVLRRVWTPQKNLCHALAWVQFSWGFQTLLVRPWSHILWSFQCILRMTLKDEWGWLQYFWGLLKVLWFNSSKIYFVLWLIWRLYPLIIEFFPQICPSFNFNRYISLSKISNCLLIARCHTWLIQFAKFHKNLFPNLKVCLHQHLKSKLCTKNHQHINERN